MTACACKPGTYDNGWMEERCEDCFYNEMQSWRGLMDRAREFAAKIRGGAA